MHGLRSHNKPKVTSIPSRVASPQYGEVTVCGVFELIYPITPYFKRNMDFQLKRFPEYLIIETTYIQGSMIAQITHANGYFKRDIRGECHLWIYIFKKLPERKITDKRANVTNC
jgi:hypothetical protein